MFFEIWKKHKIRILEHCYKGNGEADNNGQGARGQYFANSMTMPFNDYP